MSFVEGIKNFIGVGVEDEIEEEEYQEQRRFEEVPQRQNYSNFQNDFLRDGTDRNKKITDIKQSTKMKIVVIEPVSYDDCSVITDNLKNKKPVVINLEKVETDIAKRIFDFLSGATYAIDGSVQKVANSIFVFAPDNVDISQNIDEFKVLSKSNLF